MREHLMRVWQVTKKQPAELANIPESPVELGYLWQWHCELGAEWSYQDLHSWAQLRGIVLHDFEIKMLRYMARHTSKVLRGTV